MNRHAAAVLDADSAAIAQDGILSCKAFGLNWQAVLGPPSATAMASRMHRLTLYTKLRASMSVVTTSPGRGWYQEA